MAIKTCRDCGEEFDTSLKRRGIGGYVDQCNLCAKEKAEKYLGRPGATPKGANIEIFRTDLTNVKATLGRERRMGFGANLFIGHPVAQMKCDTARECADEKGEL